MTLEYFTSPEFRELASVSDYSDAAVEDAAAYIVAVIEREVGTSFIARTVTERLAAGSATIRLNSPWVQSITSVTLPSGAALTVADIESTRAGVVPYPGGGVWPVDGDNDVVVTYVAGYSTLATMPSDIKTAALYGTRARLMDTRDNAVFNERLASQSNTDGGTTTFRLADADHPTGYATVDATIVAWRNKLKVFGFA